MENKNQLLPPQLAPRLALVASMIEKGSIFADIGTDHGHLPITLLLQGHCPSGFACDVNTPPLEKAKKIIARHGLQDKIVTLQTDGLAGLEDKGVQSFVIAGMGGALIASILEKAPHLWRTPNRFILQPMTKADVLRRFLGQNGFEILREQGVFCGSFTYSVMEVAHTGIPNGNEADYLLGGLARNSDPASIAYCNRILHMLTKRLEGIQKAVRPMKVAPLQELICQVAIALEAQALQSRKEKWHDCSTDI